jgi:hypothetical protein
VSEKLEEMKHVIPTKEEDFINGITDGLEGLMDRGLENERLPSSLDKMGISTESLGIL